MGQPQPTTSQWVQFLARAQADDEQALRTLIEQLYGPVLRWVYSRAPLRPALIVEYAEDVAAETLGRVAERIKQCRATTDAEFLAWSFAIGRRVALDVLRTSMGRVFAACVRADIEETGTTVFQGVGPGDGEPPLDPDDEALVRAVMEAYDSLAAEAQGLLYYRVVAEASWREIGRAFGTTEEGARQRFRKAKARLRHSIERRIDMGDPDSLPLVRALGRRDRRRRPDQQAG